MNLQDNLTATSGRARVGFKNSCPEVRRDIPEPKPELENSTEGICPSLRESSKIAKKCSVHRVSTKK